MEAGDIVDIGEGTVVAGRSLGSGRMTDNPYLIGLEKGCGRSAQKALAPSATGVKANTVRR